MKPIAAELPFSFQSLGMAAGLKAAAARSPGKIAYTQGDRTRTYAQLVERVDRVTHALLGGCGLAAGRHIAIIAKNSIEYMEIVFGAAQAGLPIATINPRLAVPELVAICDDAGAEILFADADSAAALAGSRYATVRKIVTIGPEYEALLAQAKPATDIAPVPEWGVFTIPYTSGTTGKPKGVLVSHRSRALTLFGMAAEYGCFGPDDRFLAIAPMCHGAGMIFSLAPVFFGGHCEVMEKFEPDAVFRRLRQGAMTGFFGVPTHFHAMMSLEQGILGRERPQHLRTVISNAAALPQTMKEKLVAYFGEGLLHETYGSTEAGIVTNLRPPDQLRKQQCVGQPFPATRVELRRDDGSLCATDEVGELFSSSPYLFNGYWRKPEATAEAWKDGWVTVGDLARRDADGHYYIVDRKKDMVISGGVNLYPREIEEVLLRHPAIAEVAIVGVPDDKWGERLKAFVVKRAGAELTAAGVTAFCEGRISAMKTPKDVAFIDAIPRNANGKVLKTSLRTL
ncbi:MAG: long-chain fatty acid--CoA ligase [Gammaproteobacteria bacterium]|nr:long-chain fatty acid--CoA ligase [Gammaproteobacteria bacterium]